ncbi:hypothetical protein ABMA27_008841 [Loxostege sticticalis]|uniref:Retrotransposon gag domain-containing protein n=1 Tax=Loxostege sticticalis TaxID=481309 RepID=A0ABR3H903_LOXSC
MTEERPICFNVLNKDELLYEVDIRDGVPENTVDRLRAQIRLLANEIPTDEVSVFEEDVEAELKTVDSKIKALLLKKLKRIQSLGNHIFHRLSRVEPAAEADQTLKDQLESRLLALFSSFDFKPAEDVVPCESDLVETSLAAVRPVVNCDRVSYVHSLNLKFNGKDSVQAFIQRIEELCVSRNISKAKLFNSASKLFADEALYWYRGVRDEVTNWDSLKCLLLEEYLPYDYDHRLLHEIRSRTQGPEESISNYLSVMQNYFSRLRMPVGIDEKLSIESKSNSVSFCNT